MSEGLEHPGQTRTEAEIQSWLIARLAGELGLASHTIDVAKPLSRYGLDSMLAVGLSADLEDWLGRRLPPTLLGEYPSIAALAASLATDAGVEEAPISADSRPPGADVKQAQSGWSIESPLQGKVQSILALLVRVLCRLHIKGPGSFPVSGPYLLTMNHLHVFDTPLLFALLARPAIFFVSAHMRRFPVVNWFLSRVANTIWVSRGEGDVRAIQSALAALNSGGIVVVAPEGKISKSGGLLKGHTGAAYIATQADVPVLPVVAYGQEKAFRHWWRLRRVPVTLRIGALSRFPAGRATAKQLETYTEAIMVSLASLLPQEYRGAYRNSLPS